MSTPFSHPFLDTKALALPKISPWAVFDRIWTSSLGYHADKFDFVPGKTPLSTVKETAIIISLYYAIILGGREYMRNRPPLKLNGLFLVHNFYLTAISGFLLVLFIQQLAPSIWRHGLYQSFCGSPGWTNQLVTLYYLNYLTKYLEFIDTFFLFLKKKPLTFLHCYHHGATALLCYTQLIGHTPVSWVPITLNLTVHVLMYWYYFQSARGIKVSWKEWITRMQIAQFVIDLGFVYFASWDYFTSTYAPNLPHMGTCAGEEFAAITGCAILTSYLVLFIGFYLATYKRAGKKPITSQSTRAKVAATDMSRPEIPNASETLERAEDALGVANDALKSAGQTLMVSSMDLSGHATRRQ